MMSWCLLVVSEHTPTCLWSILSLSCVDYISQDHQQLHMDIIITPRKCNRCVKKALSVGAFYKAQRFLKFLKLSKCWTECKIYSTRQGLCFHNKEMKFLFVLKRLQRGTLRRIKFQKMLTIKNLGTHFSLVIEDNMSKQIGKS